MYCVAQADTYGWPVVSQVKVWPCVHAATEENWDGHAAANWLQPVMQSGVVVGPPVQPAATTAGQNEVQLLLPALPFELELHPAVMAATTTRIQRTSLIGVPPSIRRGNDHCDTD